MLICALFFIFCKVMSKYYNLQVFLYMLFNMTFRIVLHKMQILYLFCNMLGIKCNKGR